MSKHHPLNKKQKNLAGKKLLLKKLAEAEALEKKKIKINKKLQAANAKMHQENLKEVVQKAKNREKERVSALGSFQAVAKRRMSELREKEHVEAKTRAESTGMNRN